MEAALADPDVAFDRIPSNVFMSIGILARDVLNSTVGPCQTTEWFLDWTKIVWAEIPPLINPWGPLIPEQEGEVGLPVFDVTPLIDVALGGALVAMRQAFPYPPGEMSEEFDQRAKRAAIEGAQNALTRGIRNAQAQLSDFSRLLENRGSGGPAIGVGDAPVFPD